MTNKTSGNDGIPVELYQILKDDAVKVLHSISQQIWNTCQWPRAWKKSILIPIPKKGNDKECSSSVHFSRSVMSDYLWPHGLQHTRLPCPSPTPRAYSNSCLSSQWCHPTISSSVIPFSSSLQSFLASGSFLVSQFFTSACQDWSFSFNSSPSNEYSGLISFTID